jgi:8-hydroxy-5-deazaflavin:NADPH oxidoreductase
MADHKPTIAILGGTGKEGAGLATRWAHAGYPIIIGSRSWDRASATVQEIKQIAGEHARVAAASNREAAETGEVIVLSVPYAAQLASAEEVRSALAGKILVDVTVPLVPPKVDRVQLPEGGSAAVRLQQALGPDVYVVSAFQNVSAHHLKQLDHPIECDVLVCGDNADARETVVQLASAAGIRAFHAGALANSAAAEALTSVLIAINKRYRVPSSGIRITGVPLAEAEPTRTPGG